MMTGKGVESIITEVEGEVTRSSSSRLVININVGDIKATPQGGRKERRLIHQLMRMLRRDGTQGMGQRDARPGMPDGGRGNFGDHCAPGPDGQWRGGDWMRADGRQPGGHWSGTARASGAGTTNMETDGQWQGHDGGNWPGVTNDVHGGMPGMPQSGHAHMPGTWCRTIRR
jgi:hypothetical protein